MQRVKLDTSEFVKIDSEGSDINSNLGNNTRNNPGKHPSN